MKTYGKEDIVQKVKENNVKFIRLQFTDILGTPKNVAITSEQLEKALDNKMMFDGSSIEGFVRIEESDMYLWPDLNTFTIFPWNYEQGKVARLICDIYNSDGTPFIGDPRYALRRTIKKANAMGFDKVNVGPECEFFLFHTDSEGKPTTITHDNGSYFDLGPLDNGESARREIVLALADMGFEIEASHHEVAPGQHEIDFKYTDALTTADNIMTFKLVVKSIAKKNGLHATFMPKPVYGIHGSGMHINTSLYKDNKNAFFKESDSLGLSQDAYYFIGGVLKNIKDITALTNPIVNSYKRLVPGFEAPVYIAWSTGNRSPLIRIPTARGEATRIEIRSPDPSCNPYLALAGIIEAGLYGIENKIIPSDPICKNIYDMNKEERKEAGIDSLPANLGEAIGKMHRSDLALEALGKHIFSKYIEAKKEEWNDYKVRVTPWEIERYLMKY